MANDDLKPKSDHKSRKSEDVIKTKHKTHKRKHSSSTSRSPTPVHKKKHSKKHKKRSRSTSSNSTSTDSEKERERKKKKKAKKKAKKLIKELKKIQKKKDKEKKDKGDKLCNDVPLELMEKAKAMAPMTKEEWEKKQSVVKRVFDEETGRHRLIKGDGEVIEEIVSRDRHKAINKQATEGDGNFFQKILNTNIKK